jgi:hypothetical protein
MFQRGQMSSPFELFVAIIIMTFVIIIGTQMLASANANACMASIDRELIEFKQMLEDTAQRRSQNKFEFRPDDCFNQNQATIKIVKYTQPSQCSVACGKPMQYCWAMVFSAPDLTNGFKKKCLNLPQYTTFTDSPTICKTTDEQLKGYKAIDPTEEITSTDGTNPEDGINFTTTNLKPGSYILRNVAGAGKTYPEMCVFRKA